MRPRDSETWLPGFTHWKAGPLYYRKSIQSSLCYPRGIGSRTPTGIKMLRCSSPWQSALPLSLRMQNLRYRGSTVCGCLQSQLSGQGGESTTPLCLVLLYQLQGRILLASKLCAAVPGDAVQWLAMPGSWVPCPSPHPSSKGLKPRQREMGKPLSRTVSKAGGLKHSRQRNPPVWRMAIPPSYQPSFCHTYYTIQVT